MEKEQPPLLIVVPDEPDNHQPAAIHIPSRKRKNQEKPPPVGRKRIKAPSTWMKLQTKSARNAGLAYVNSSAKQCPEKKMKAPCQKSCRLKCSDRISEEVRRKVRSDFYRTKDQIEKWHFIRNLVRCNKPLRPKYKDDPKRMSRKYFFFGQG